MENRRRFLRVSFEEKFEVKTQSWSDPSATGIDISLNGCRFHCEQFLSEDENATFYFKQGLELKGRIRWCWPIEWYYLSAVHFENISEKEQEKLKSYIEEVTGENYQMEKLEENNKEISENSNAEVEIDFEDIEEIDDLSFDVIDEDQEDVSVEEGGKISDSEISNDLVDIPTLNEEDLEDLPALNEEDLNGNKGENQVANKNSFSEEINNVNISHKFAEGDLNPLSFNGKHVVIFDMDKEHSEILNRYLSERIGMEVEAVSKKQNLWRILKIDPVDLIILESGSNSNSDALEVMQQTEDQFPGINYFCISEPVSLERRLQFLNAGALDYITRPSHLSTIAQSILIHLSRLDFYKIEDENDESNTNTDKAIINSKNLDHTETFHDEDLSDNLELTDKNLDVSREIELIDEDF